MSKVISPHWYKQAIEIAIITDNFYLAEKYYKVLVFQNGRISQGKDGY